MSRRVILIVMDSLGVGSLEDAWKFDDEGANTLLHILEKRKYIDMLNLRKLGIFAIDGFEKYRDNVVPAGAFGRMKEMSKGKDTTVGHWEIAGIVTEIPFKTYEKGFPEEFIKAFEEKIGRKTIGNIPISGTEIIEKLGPRHEETGEVIVYTSEDSVFQIAANTDVIPLNELYKICETAREMLTGQWACARVIARPYVIKDGRRVRTSDRHDYSVSPPEKTMLDMIKESGKTVYAVGKIYDIFAGKGITEKIATSSNDDGITKTLDAMKKVENGLIFTNLVDFDALYGHRRNPEGYAEAIEAFDKRLPEIIENLRKEDILIITADHGNDPVFKGFNHTREYVPLLVYGKTVVSGINLGTRESFTDIAKSVCRYLKTEEPSVGNSFIEDVVKSSKN